MNTRTIRRLAASLALAVAIAAPGAALAGTSQTTTTTESLVAANVAMVVPASATFTGTGTIGVYQYSLAVTGLTTDSAAGLVVKAQVSTLTGPATIATTDRQMAPATSLSAGLTASSPASTAYGTFLTSATQLAVVSSSGPVASGGFTTWPTVRNVSVNGTYSSTLTLIATAN